jgi:cation:H+ antiporter
MLTAGLLILAGLCALITGAEVLVRGAVWIALRLGISPMTIGLTLVAFGTSAPELMVSLEAARLQRADIALSNVLGSNLANVLLIVGVAASMRRIRLYVDRMECWFMLLATALAGVPYLLGTGIDRLLGSGMVVLLLCFCWLLLHRERRRPEAHRTTATAPGGAPRWALNVAFVLLGLGLLKYGADWLIDGAIDVARVLGMSEVLIGMTIVAVGTSLPELATSVVAARRGHPEIAVGNILGSNIFNIGMVLGLTALVFPLPVAHAATGPLMVATAVSAVVLVAVLRQFQGVPRGVGAAFLLSWGGYVAWEIMRSLGA